MDSRIAQPKAVPDGPMLPALFERFQTQNEGDERLADQLEAVASRLLGAMPSGPIPVPQTGGPRAIPTSHVDLLIEKLDARAAISARIAAAIDRLGVAI